MGKFVLFLSSMSLLFLEAGSYFVPADPIMWLANASNLYALARGIVILFMLVLLLTTPSRRVLLRLAIGSAAAATLAIVVVLTYESKMMLLDTLSLAAGAVAMGIGALEINYCARDVDIEALRRAKSPGKWPANVAFSRL